ncbi:MAG: hypothetical protein L6V88_01790 [Anaerotruncus sp.]|nr:MAG: hypothetical protein L6V88_01790 [Anaerotruncus sp.]
MKKTQWQRICSKKLMLALRLPTEALEKPAVANLKLSVLTTFTLGLLDKKTVQTICNMFNLEQDAIITDEGVLEPKWWKRGNYLPNLSTLLLRQ